MSVLGVGAYRHAIIKGVAIIAAVMLDRLQHKASTGIRQI